MEADGRSPQGSVTNGTTQHITELAMKKYLIPRISGALTLTVFAPSILLAGPGPRTPGTADNPEPRRIYDIASRNFIDNPDYREPAPARQSTKPSVRFREPSRVYNPMTQQFEDPPVYRTPANAREPGNFAPRSTRKRALAPSEARTSPR